MSESGRAVMETCPWGRDPAGQRTSDLPPQKTVVYFIEGSKMGLLGKNKVNKK